MVLRRRPLPEDRCAVDLPETGISLITNDLNQRGEIKLTGTIANNHTIQGGYLNNYRERTNNSGLQSFIIDPASEVDRTNPNMYYFTNYRGVRGNTIWEGHTRSANSRSPMKAAPAPTSSIRRSSRCRARALQRAVLRRDRPENRNNRQFSGNVTTFWNGRGRHETKVGYEFFRSQRTGGSSQSSTSCVFNADFELQGGLPVPHFVPGETYLENYIATRGATMTSTTSRRSSRTAGRSPTV